MRRHRDLQHGIQKKENVILKSEQQPDLRREFFLTAGPELGTTAPIMSQQTGVVLRAAFSDDIQLLLAAIFPSVVVISSFPSVTLE